ncbi:MAG: RNA-binding protein [Hormoscilla sp. SP5CHS1]|nr:RNA-binding protein [Hormoscilla sp. SP12CHS1]MBC6455185.1 RNA-binding protein [Hormoscilla sp. SP5CHS1]
MNESQIQRGKEWLEEFLHKAGLPATVTRQENQAEPGMESCWLTIDSQNLTAQQMETLTTGKEGVALDAIQYLANTILNLGCTRNEQIAYTIELNGYRARRQAELLQMASDAATQVRRTGVPFEMKDLSAAERRQVHTFLKSYEDIASESRGREPDRRLIVRRL